MVTAAPLSGRRGSSAGARAVAILLAVARRTLTFLGIGALLVVGWWAALRAFDISSFIGKTPADVWAYLVSGPGAADHRHTVFDGVGHTLHDAIIGYGAGLIGALVIAVVFTLVPAAALTFMPTAMVLRTFPLVALTPLVILVCGRGDRGLAAIGFIVVFFAALVTISFGIAGARGEALDMVAVFGGGRWARLVKVSLPSALPALCTAARIAVPQSISGALIAEWLVTGTGSGNQLAEAAGQSEYDAVWSICAVLIASATIVYTVLSVAEEIVLLRFRPID
ncbi:MAG: ABC transporter permease subunit [Gordonia sp. (in: high G+C Gram-positive bacteria)]